MEIYIEVWKDITGYENFYRISNKWRVKSLGRYIKYSADKKRKNGVRFQKEKILNPFSDKDWYLSVALVKDKLKKTYKISRLVYLTFNHLPLTYELLVLHNDDNVKNNYLCNLRKWTHQDNMNDKVLRWRCYKWGHYWKSSLTNIKVRLIKLMLNMWEKHRVIWDYFWVKRQTISHINQWVSWKHIL